MLEEILEIGEKKVIGVDYNGINKRIKNPSNESIPLKKKIEYRMNDHILNILLKMYIFTMEATRDHLGDVTIVENMVT